MKCWLRSANTKTESILLRQTDFGDQMFGKEILMNMSKERMKMTSDSHSVATDSR